MLAFFHSHQTTIYWSYSRQPNFSGFPLLNFGATKEGAKVVWTKDFLWKCIMYQGAPSLNLRSDATDLYKENMIIPEVLPEKLRFFKNTRSSYGLFDFMGGA